MGMGCRGLHLHLLALYSMAGPCLLSVVSVMLSLLIDSYMISSSNTVVEHSLPISAQMLEAYEIKTY